MSEPASAKPQKLLDQLRDDIRTVQERLGYKDVKTTIIYTHVFNCGPKAVRRSLDE